MGSSRVPRQPDVPLRSKPQGARQIGLSVCE
uniref:Uncharacterized protein n=1 Tax=Anguilla anguilla TaxID=7936 RepID=A0A0E9PBJ4_ANGAN